MNRAGTVLLEQCLALLRSKAPLEAWPAAVREAFLGALYAPVDALPEQQKARDLRRHLFRDRGGPAPHSAVPSIAADRIRADLIGLVPLGAGLHLTEGAPLRTRISR